MHGPDNVENALRALGAAAITENNLAVAAIAARNPSLVSRLGKFSFPHIAAAVGGLLTVPENHPATYRLETLVTLAAAYARGIQAPTTAQLKEWLNDILLADPVGQFEDPVEDVFVSNVPSWDGNARLFDGWWGNNDIGVEALVWAMMKMKAKPWAAEALDASMALLTLSEAIATRADVARYTMSEGRPAQPIRITGALVGAVGQHVRFSFADLMSLGLPAKRLAPFALTAADRAALAGESIGHSSLDRRPLLRDGTTIIVAAPTALGAAIRRFILEAATAAGALAEVEKVVAEAQFAELGEFGLTGLRGRIVRDPAPCGENCHDLVATFDEGGFVHLIYVGDRFDQIAGQGLRSLHQVPAALVDHADAVAAEYAAREDYARGMTLIVHGGVGRGFAIPFSKAAPPRWHRIGLEFPDMARFTWEHGFDALRVWKVAEQEEELPGRGYSLTNVNGFANLYGYLRERHMTLVPDDVEPGEFALSPGHVASIRGFLRKTLDAHVVMNAARDRWVEVRRSATDVFFEEVRNLPLFVSPVDIAQGAWASCVETDIRPWWISIDRDAETSNGRAIAYQFWDMAQNWLLRAAPRIEAIYPDLSAGPISIRLELPGVDGFVPSDAFSRDNFGAPDVRVEDGAITISCDVEQLAAFARADNIGERQVIAAFAEGAARLAGAVPTSADLEAFAMEVARSRDARFFHMLPPRTPAMLVYAASDVGSPRLVTEEDIAWGRLGLAELAGWTSGPGPVPLADAPKLLNAAVDAIWSRMRNLMATLDREGLVAMALANHDAVAWDRHNWGQTARALTGLYDDAGDIVAASNRLEAQRSSAGLGSRVLAEMAICTATESGGRPANRADFDALLADVTILIECANQADAIHWKLNANGPLVAANGDLLFDTAFLEQQQRPYLDAHGERAFRNSASGYADIFEPAPDVGPLELDPRFQEAIEDEFGIGLEALARFVMDLSREAAEQGTNLLRLPRSEVVSRLAGHADDLPAIHPEKAFDALTLKPRARWDEAKPEGAKARDWYPWRFSRRLALLQRPMAQVGTGEDPLVLILPTLLDNFVIRLFAAEAGSLPMDLYSGAKMRSWIGTAVNREGHAFNKRIAELLKSLGWQARSDVKMTELGGTKEQGDVDVLAWQSDTGEILAVECKRLQMARAIGEIGERLFEYGEIAGPGEPPTPIQKHVTRIDFLRTNPARLAHITGIAAGKQTLVSTLVTDHLVPMQFSKRAGGLVDVIADVQSIPGHFDRNAEPDASAGSGPSPALE